MRLLSVDEQVIVCDLSGVTFLDSSTLEVFIAAHVELSLDGRELRLVGASPHIRRVLEASGIDIFLHVT